MEEFYSQTLQSFQSTNNERLWLKTNIKLAKLYLDRKDYAAPALGLVSYSFLTQAPDGTIGLPVTFQHYRHFFGTPLYSHVLLTTLRISLCTTATAVLLAYPVALVMSPVISSMFA